MNDAQIHQITYVDEHNVAWVAAVGAAIIREDNQAASNKSVRQIIPADDDMYDVLIFGGDTLRVKADKDTVIYKRPAK